MDSPSENSDSEISNSDESSEEEIDTRISKMPCNRKYQKRKLSSSEDDSDSKIIKKKSKRKSDVEQDANKNRKILKHPNKTFSDCRILLKLSLSLLLFCYD